MSDQPKKWKPGDLVHHVTSNQKMLVISQGPAIQWPGLGTTGSDVVVCEWVDGNGVPRRDAFAPDSLLKAD